MPSFLSFFIIILAAVIFSRFFLRMRIPWVVALIIGGIIIGPNFLGVFEADATINFLANIGLVFLMFMAGLEARFSDSKGIKAKIITTSIVISLLPALVGIIIGLVFNYSWSTAILLGIIFMSSAIALLIPSLTAQKIIGSDLGKIILGSAITVDALSLILLSIFLQFVSGTLVFWTIILYPLLIGVLVLLIWGIPKIHWLAFPDDYPEEQDLFEKELRFVILILVGFVVFFELIGLHAIIAGFFAGLALSRSMKSRILKAKLHAISYGFFIPVFFVVIGASTDISVFARGAEATLIALAIIIGLIISKFLSGFMAGKLWKFTNKESAFVGFSVIPQLSTSLAVAFLGFGSGILDQNLLSSIVALTIVTSILAPIAVSILGRELKTQKVEVTEPSVTISNTPTSIEANSS